MNQLSGEPGVIITTPDTASGGEGLVRLVGGPVGRRKLQPSTKDNDLKLAPTTTNEINLKALAADDAQLAAVLRHITDVNAFIELFEEELVKGSKYKRPLSRGMLHHAGDMVKFDIAEDERVIDTPQRISGALRQVYHHACIYTFLVKKKTPGLGRLIGDARTVNGLQRRPPDMGLPRVHAIICDILSWSHGAKTDGVGYFYQFVLNPQLRPFFRTRLAGKARGEIRSMLFKRMPMGWKYSPWIAQQTSNFLVRGCGRAWLDDFIIGGKTKADFSVARTTFLKRVKRYNVKIDNEALEPTTQLAALGLYFDLQRGRYRIDSEWIQRRREVFERPRSEPQTIRSVLELFGTLIWASHVCCRPLWEHAEAMACLSAAAKACEGDYERMWTIPQYAQKDIDEWIRQVTKNDWVTREDVVRRPQDEHYIFSDASDTGGGFVEVLKGAIVASDSWRRSGGEHIFLAETEALAAGGKHTADVLAPLYCTDNQPLHYAVSKGHSSSYAANCLLRETFGHQWPRSAWLPTDVNTTADKLSRDHAYRVQPGPVNEELSRAIDYVERTTTGGESANSKRFNNPASTFAQHHTCGEV